MNRFVFFNKQEVTSEDMNAIFLKLNEHILDLLKGVVGPGFFETPNSSQYYGIKIKRPYFVASYNSNYVTIAGANSGVSAIAGIDKAGNPIVIPISSRYQNTNPTISSGTMDIPINPTGQIPPFYRYIWIEYRESIVHAIVRYDYDGAPQKPIRINGYNVIVSDQDPSVYVPGAALYVGRIYVDESETQFYYYGPGVSPYYDGQLKAGVVENNVIIHPDVSQKTTSYTNLAGSLEQRTLKDHINCFGTNSVVTAENPHGISPNDMDKINTQNITDHCITPEKLSPSVFLEAVPIGTIIMWPGSENTVPSKWMICDGRLLSITEYNELYLVIGKLWGDWSFAPDRFPLPDLRGMFIRGAFVDVPFQTGSLKPMFGGDPEILSRVDRLKQQVINRPSGVGTYQRDAFQDHVHQYQFPEGDYQSIERGDDVDSDNVRTDTTEARQKSDAPVELHKSDYETRGKNAMLFFIIKVK